MSLVTLIDTQWTCVMSLVTTQANFQALFFLEDMTHLIVLPTWLSIGGGKENTSDGNFGGRLSFFTRVHNGIDTERLCIDSSGQVKITDGGSLNFDAAANGNYDIAYKSADNTFNIINNSSSAPDGLSY